MADGYNWGDFWDAVCSLDELPTRDELVEILQKRPPRPWLDEDYPSDVM